MHYIAESAIQETLEQYTTNLIMHYIDESAIQETLEQYTTCLNNALHS